MKSFKSRRFQELQLTLVPTMDGSMQRPEACNPGVQSRVVTEVAESNTNKGQNIRVSHCTCILSI